MTNPQIDICLSPLLYPLHKRENQLVIVIDVIRASTSIAVAINTGVNFIVPVLTPEEALSYKSKGYITSGERDSFKLPLFDLGNSPFEFMDSRLKGKNLIMTTTNGTKAIKTAEGADDIIIGSFINLNIVKEYSVLSRKNILMLCAGWTQRINIEDSLFAGRIAQELLENGKFSFNSDTVKLATQMASFAGNNIFDFVIDSSPRLKSKLDRLEEDIRFCLEPTSQLNVIPIFKDGRINKLED